MRTKLSLETKFTSIIVIVFIIGIITSFLVLSRVLEQRAEDEVSARGLVLLEAMNSVRHYTSTQINPLLAPRLETEWQFIPETVPAYSAREVFERLRRSGDYSQYLYKEATLNPTNPRDLADPFEAALVAEFRANSALDQLTGFTERDGQHVFYNARPLSVTSPTCLNCHGNPADAPASLIASYGTDGGFGWQLGEVIAAQIIYVPAEDVFASARLSLTAVMIIISVIFAVVVFAINALLKRAVVIPVQRLAGLAQRISDESLSPNDPELATVSQIAQRSDELGRTANVFQRMAREVYSREQQLKQEVRQLTIQIDQSKREQQVKQITETDFFQDLQKKAKEMRASQGLDRPANAEEVPT